MGAAFRIAGKDLKLRLRDRSVFILGIIAPLALALIFNLVFGGATDGEALDLDYGLVDLDGSEVSRAFGEVLDEIEAEGVFTVTGFETPDEALQAIEDDDLDAYFLIEPGFSQAVITGNAKIGVVGDADAPTSAGIAASIADQLGNGVETTSLAFIVTAEAAGLEQLDPAFFAGLEGDPSRAAFSYQLVDVSAATRQLDATTFFAAGMAVFFLFFTVQFGVAGLLEEEREGTLARLFAAPISRRSVVLGKALLSFALGMISMMVLVVATQLVMGASWGAPLGVGLLVAAGVGSAVGIMGLVAAVARSPEGAGNIGAIIAVSLGMLGGVFFPIGQGDDFLSRLSQITPHFWFMRGLGDLAAGASWTQSLPAVGALLVFTTVTATVAWLLLRRRLVR